ncbi:MAG: c-type cytochrome biogenesis protein CcsB [Anaeromyxobacteraceae bacterium]
MLQYILVEHPYFSATGFLYAVSMAFYVATWLSPSKTAARLATAVMAAAVAVNGGLFIGMWVQAGRAPLKSLFETAIFLAFNIGLLYLVLERLYRTRIFGAVAAFLAVASIVFALTKWDAEIQKLPAALQSGWFVPHVWVYFVGYAAVAMAAGISVMQLLSHHSPFVRRLLTIKAGSVLSGEELDLEKVAYDSIKFGFVLLTFGLLVGSVWAKSAWGDFWVWDPKENWSLVTWLVYAAYLHLRKVKGWRGDAAAWFAIIGFAVVIFTYVGIGMLPTSEESAHVYSDN